MKLLLLFMAFSVMLTGPHKALSEGASCPNTFMALLSEASSLEMQMNTLKLRFKTNQREWERLFNGLHGLRFLLPLWKQRAVF